MPCEHCKDALIEAAASGSQPQGHLRAQLVASNANNSQTRGHSTLLRRVTSSQPEVLVPPDEHEALSRFVATLRERGDVAIALVTPSSDAKGGPASLKRLQIDPLEVKLLEGTESEESDGAGNRR